MARKSDQLAGQFEIENTGGVMSGLLAEEDVFDRRALWRIGSWGVGALGAVVLAVLANQSQLSLRREQFAAADLTRQADRLQSFAKESSNESRRLASAVDTLNGDRDRLYSRVTVLEQGLDSVTGAIAKQNAAAAQPQPQAAATSAPAASPAPAEPKLAAQNPAPPPAPAPANPPPVVSPVATMMALLPAKPVDKPPPAATPEQAPPAVIAVAPKTADPPPPAAAPTSPAPLVAAKSMMAPPDPAAAKLIEPEKPAKTVNSSPIPDVVAVASPADQKDEDASPPAAAKAPVADVAVQKTEFGVDVGGANSVPGLRALWRGLLKSRSNAALAALRPIIVIREGNNGLGMQLRLVVGPLSDAAAAAKICAGLVENDRPCETAVFDGQRLAMRPDEQAVGEPRASAAKPAVEAKPVQRRRGSSRRVSTNEEQAKKPETTSTLSSFFGRR